MRKPSQFKSQIQWLKVGLILFSTSVFAQTEESDDPAEDPTAESGDSSYELQRQGDDATFDQPDSSTEPEEAAADPDLAPDEMPPEGGPDTSEPAPQSEVSSPISFLAGNSYSILVGIAKLTLSSDMKDLAGSGNQLGILVKYHNQTTGAFGIHYGLDLRMAKLTRDLSAPTGVNANPSSRLRQSDVFAMAIGDYSFSPLFGAFFNVGLGVQYRSFYIKADSNELPDDYFSGYALGYLLRVGGQIEFPVMSQKLVSRLYYGFEGGNDLESGKLKYNRKKVDINPRQTLLGLDVGVHF